MLKGKTALVTGSTSGIGLGVAQCLARAGRQHRAQRLRRHRGRARPRWRRSACKVGYHGADMSKPAEIEDMMAYAEREFGGVDVLVNNAGIQHVAPVEDFPVEKWDAIIAINLSSAFHTTRLALPGMKRDELGPRHQHRVGARAGRLGAEVGLRGGQARHRRLHQGGGARNGDHRRHRQRHLPRLGADAAGAEADRRARRARRHRDRRGQAPTCWPRSSRRCSSPRRSSWASWRCSCARRPPTTCAAWPGTSTAAGPRSRPQYRSAVSGFDVCTAAVHRHAVTRCALPGFAPARPAGSPAAPSAALRARIIGIGRTGGGSLVVDVDLAQRVAGDSRTACA